MEMMPRNFGKSSKFSILALIFTVFGTGQVGQASPNRQIFFRVFANTFYTLSLASGSLGEAGGAGIPENKS